MNPRHSKASIRIRLIAAGTCLTFFAGCAQIAVVSAKHPAPLPPGGEADRVATQTINHALSEEQKQPIVTLGGFARPLATIGDRGRGDSPNSSDGVVACWRSYLSGARSEFIAPCDHGSPKNPQAIAEVHRILHSTPNPVELNHSLVLKTPC
jgi:hypothetical protein